MSLYKCQSLPLISTMPGCTYSKKKTKKNRNPVNLIEH